MRFVWSLISGVIVVDHRCEGMFWMCHCNVEFWYFWYTRAEGIRELSSSKICRIPLFQEDWMDSWLKISHFIMPPQSEFRGYIDFGFFECQNFNLAHNFWIVSDRGLVFHFVIPCDKTFLLEPTLFDLVTLTLEFGLL